MNNNTKDFIKDLHSSNRLAYLLHLWRSAGQWRASLENLETGKRLGFANLELLFAYLMDQTEGNLAKEGTNEAE
ncbi:MAG TPA: hypothetical protein VFY66_19825 [Anaerolineales bacterium]|nr:hypothetical protein [Anaerolineales bacterium]